ncbi:MAG: AAA family ATPase, partial [Ruminococcus sp.]|nr:AAA family ATPase [Ruminococcus sp.]
MAPVFRSTPTSFFVTLYNLNYRITVENTDIDKTKQGHSEEKADFEMRVSAIKANQPTKNNIIKLFR